MKTTIGLLIITLTSSAANAAVESSNFYNCTMKGSPEYQLSINLETMMAQDFDNDHSTLYQVKAVPSGQGTFELRTLADNNPAYQFNKIKKTAIYKNNDRWQCKAVSFEKLEMDGVQVRKEECLKAQGRMINKASTSYKIVQQGRFENEKEFERTAEKDPHARFSTDFYVRNFYGFSWNDFIQSSDLNELGAVEFKVAQYTDKETGTIIGFSANIDAEVGDEDSVVYYYSLLGDFEGYDHYALFAGYYVHEQGSYFQPVCAKVDLKYPMY